MALPENGSTTDNTPTFKWVIGSYADNHRIEIAYDINFTPPLLENVVLGATNDTYTASFEYSEDNYYWRVWAINQWGENVSENWIFEVIAGLLPSKPVLVSPENGQGLYRLVTFVWRVGLNADNHRIEIDDDFDFSSPEENVVLGPLDNTYTVILDYSGVLYWRVWAVNVSGENRSENIWQFTVIPWCVAERWSGAIVAPPPIPTSISISPADFTLESGESITLTATLKDNAGDPLVEKTVTWTATVGSLSPASGTTNSLGEVTTIYTAPTVTVETLVTVTASFAGDVDYGASQGNSTGTISPPPVEGITLPGQPTLIYPENGRAINDSTPALEWDSVTGATSYELQVDEDENFSSPVENEIGITQTSHETTALADGVYYWRIRAVNAAGPGPWSEVWQFKVDTTEPGAPTPLKPTNGSLTNDDNPQFEWSSVFDASPPVLYRVYLDDDWDFATVERDSGWIGNTSWEVTTPLGEGRWYWRVQAKDDVGNLGDNSPTWSLTVDVTPPGEPVLFIPADNEILTTFTPEFDWSDVTDPSDVDYTLQISPELDFTPISFEKTAIPLSNYTLSPVEALAVGGYYWRVRAVDGAGNWSRWSIRSFTIENVEIPPEIPPENVQIPLEIPPEIRIPENIEKPQMIRIQKLDENENFHINFLEINPAAPVTKIVVMAKHAMENVDIAVAEVDPKVEAVPGVPFYYIRIMAFVKGKDLSENVSSVITFRILKSWVENERVDEATITLYLFDEEEGWQTLHTKLVKSGPKYLYFEAQVPELGLFAVAGTYVPPPPSPPPLLILVALAVLGGGIAFYVGKRLLVSRKRIREARVREPPAKIIIEKIGYQ